MKECAILLIVLISGVLIGGCLSILQGQKDTSLVTSVPTPYPQVTVLIKARAFDPAIITIKEGTTVTWTNEDPMSHYVVHLPEANRAALFDSGPVSPKQSFSYTFLEKGRYNYGDPQIGGGRSSLVIVE